jgi:hypothetical protein
MTMSTSPARRTLGRRTRRQHDHRVDHLHSPVEVSGARREFTTSGEGGSNPGLRVARHRATTAHLASLYPFHGGHALAGLAAPYVGVNVTDGGSAWCFDPFELYGRDLGGGIVVTNSNMLVLGEPGNGKSTAVKTMLWRQAGYYGARRFIAVSDPKGEYGPLADAVGMPVVRLAPGGRERLNPLDPGSGDPATSLLARQSLLIGMLAQVLRRELNGVEESVLAVATERVDDVHRHRSPPTLGDLAGVLGELPAVVRRHRHLSLLSDGELNASLTALRVGLVKLLEHTLRGMFDGPSTVTVDWTSGPGLTVDLSAVFGNAEALPLVQMTTNAWLSAQMANLQPEGRRGILVEDEVWATTGSERAAKALQARLKLCRLYGIWNILVTHRLSDLRAQSDDGTAAAKVAAGLVGDVQTKVVFRQANEELDDARRLLRLNDRTLELLPRLTKGRALWVVAGRSAVVHHVVGTTTEAALVDTDSAMAA